MSRDHETRPYRHLLIHPDEEGPLFPGERWERFEALGQRALAVAVALVAVYVIGGALWEALR